MYLIELRNGTFVRRFCVDSLWVEKATKFNPDGVRVQTAHAVLWLPCDSLEHAIAEAQRISIAIAEAEKHLPPEFDPPGGES